MLIVIGIASAAVAACLFAVLYEVGHKEKVPAWANEWGGFEFLVPVVIAGLVSAVMFPLQFLLEYQAHTFDVTDAVLSAIAALAGTAGVFAITRRQRRHIENNAVETNPAPWIVVSNDLPGTNDPTPDPRPLRPTGSTRKRQRKAA